MSRPDLPLIAEIINAKLRDEDAKRKKFRNDLTPSVKAEFIAGEVIMHSPAKANHLRATEKLVRLLATFSDVRQLGEVFSEKALICLTRNAYEPDVCSFKSEKGIGFHADTMEFPAPDFVVEVLSDSTAARDRGVKFEDNAQHGIGEYWIIDCDEQSIEQYILRDGETQYHLACKLTEGEIESVIVCGFRIPVAAVLDSAQIGHSRQRPGKMSRVV